MSNSVLIAPATREEVAALFVGFELAKSSAVLVAEPLPPHTKQALAREHERLALVERQIKEIARAQAVALKATTWQEGEREEEARGGGAAERGAAQAATLVRLHGIGQTSALPLCREVFYRHFNNRRELAGHFGPTPSPYNSGSMRVDQGISKAGNPRARSLAIEIAWLWVRHQPDSALTRWFLQRVPRGASDVLLSWRWLAN